MLPFSHFLPLFNKQKKHLRWAFTKSDNCQKVIMWLLRYLYILFLWLRFKKRNTDISIEMSIPWLQSRGWPKSSGYQTTYRSQGVNQKTWFLMMHTRQLKVNRKKREEPDNGPNYHKLNTGLMGSNQMMAHSPGTACMFHWAHWLWVSQLSNIQKLWCNRTTV